MIDDGMALIIWKLTVNHSSENEEKRVKNYFRDMTPLVNRERSREMQTMTAFMSAASHL